MKNMAKICSVLQRSFCVSIFAFTAIFMTSLPVRADEDPFQIDKGHWMSFDHYKDADKRGILAQPIQKTDVEAPADEAQNTAAISVPAATQTTPAVAAPTRPIDLPVMPGMNKGFSVQVNTTEDERIAPPPVVDANVASDIHISDKNWQSPSSVTTTKTSSDDDDTVQPLSIRLSYLPDSKITPVPSPEHETAEQKAREAVAKGLKIQQQIAQEVKKQPAVCAAIDAYKKQQLNAIQSDRETLKALQAAIASLGFQKQLGFMTSSAGALNSSSASTPTNIDVPVSTSVQ